MNRIILNHANSFRPMFLTAIGIGILFLFSSMPATWATPSQSPYRQTIPTPPAPTPTPSCCVLVLPVCHESSVYTVTNPSSYRTTTTDVFYVGSYPPGGSIVHHFVDRFEPFESKVYRLDAIPDIPNGFRGTVAILCDHPVTGSSSKCPPPKHDVAVVAVAPSGARPVNKAFTVQAELRNLGDYDESNVPVTCTITHAGATVYEQSRNSGVIRPSAWALLEFPAYTPTALGDYIITCQSALPGDEYPANDVLSRTLTIVESPPDAYTRDNERDNGDVPSGDDWYYSPDIWVRHAADGGLEHQDAISGTINTVYVRLRNRGGAATSGTVDVTWIEPSLAVRCGDWAPIGPITFTNLLPGEERIISTTWRPTRSGHTCLQTVIDAIDDPYNRGRECSPNWVPWDNNVSWRNVEILNNSGSRLMGALDVKQAEVQLVNIYDRPKDVDVVIDRKTFPITGTITVQLPETLFDRWLAYGARWGSGIEVLTATKEIRVTGAVSATIGAVPMLADEKATVGLRFDGPAGLEFELAISERIDGLTVGGVAYQWVIPDTTPPGVIAHSPASGATEVALAAPIVITFTEQIGPLSLNLALTPDPGGWFYTWNEAGTVVTATHASLVNATVYTATLMARDGSANPMAAPFTWSFTTTEKYRLFLPLALRNFGP